MSLTEPPHWNDAVLSGVFKKHNLVHAQKDGLAIFWAHNLSPLGDFISSTK